MPHTSWTTYSERDFSVLPTEERGSPQQQEPHPQWLSTRRSPGQHNGLSSSWAVIFSKGDLEKKIRKGLVDLSECTWTSVRGMSGVTSLSLHT